MTHRKLCIGNGQNDKSLNAEILIKLVVLTCTFLILRVRIILQIRTDLSSFVAF